MAPKTLRFAFDIRRPPASVKRWWTEWPDDYRASDPREQPHRIEVLERTPDGAVVRSHWRMGNREIAGVERLRLGPDGTWTFEMDGPSGVSVRDLFVARATPQGTRLDITTTLTPRGLKGRLALPLIARFAAKNFARTWADAAQICERDAP